MTTQNLTCLSLDNQLAKTGVGERTREGNDLYNEMSEAGVINQKDLKSSKIALVYGQMNEPPGARLRVALSGLAITEYFRDEKNQDVLLFIDNIFRFSQAGAEVSSLLGRTASAVGYQPTLAAEMGALLDDYDLYPEEVLSEIARKIGFGDKFDEIVDLSD